MGRDVTVEYETRSGLLPYAEATTTVVRLLNGFSLRSLLYCTNNHTQKWVRRALRKKWLHGPFYYCPWLLSPYQCLMYFFHSGWQCDKINGFYLTQMPLYSRVALKKTAFCQTTTNDQMHPAKTRATTSNKNNTVASFYLILLFCWKYSCRNKLK